MELLSQFEFSRHFGDFFAKKNELFTFDKIIPMIEPQFKELFIDPLPDFHLFTGPFDPSYVDLPHRMGFQKLLSYKEPEAKKPAVHVHDQKDVAVIIHGLMTRCLANENFGMCHMGGQENMIIAKTPKGKAVGTFEINNSNKKGHSRWFLKARLFSELRDAQCPTEARIFNFPLGTMTGIVQQNVKHRVTY